MATGVGDSRIAVRLVFNRRGEIEQTVAERPRLEARGTTTPWIGVYADYRPFGGVRVPTRGEVRWELPDGPFTYGGQITLFELRDQALSDPSTEDRKPSSPFCGRLLGR